MTDRNFSNAQGLKSPHFGNNFAFQAQQVVYRKRSNIFNVVRFSGYCSVVFLVKNSRSVTFIPVSNEKSPLKNEVIYLIILFIVSSLKM